MEKTVLGFFLSIPVKRGSIRHSETSPLPQLAIQLCSTLVICQEGQGGAVSVEHFGPGVNAIHIESIVILYQKEIKEKRNIFFWLGYNKFHGWFELRLSCFFLSTRYTILTYSCLSSSSSFSCIFILLLMTPGGYNKPIRSTPHDSLGGIYIIR